MGVYNGLSNLPSTVASILSQEDVDLELIIVDDGSTDETYKYLTDVSRDDSRVRVLGQSNQGLTAALVFGCGSASGRYIARQDVGDISLPRRLCTQLNRLRGDYDAVLCSCYADVTGPRGEHLYTSRVNEAELKSGPQLLGEGLPKGPSHHGSVMMRRDVYEAVGGYRKEFYFAQDVDLWSRLAEKGRHAVVPEVLYQARLEAASISGQYAAEQRRTAELIRQATEVRRAGGDEGVILRAAERIRPQTRKTERRRLATGAYFIGSCLQHRDPSGARSYFLQAVKDDPLHWKAWVRLMGLRRVGGGEP